MNNNGSGMNNSGSGINPRWRHQCVVFRAGSKSAAIEPSTVVVLVLRVTQNEFTNLSLGPCLARRFCMCTRGSFSGEHT